MAKASEVEVPQEPGEEQERVEFHPDQSTGYLLRDTFRAFSKVLAARISAHGVTLGQWYFLRVLWEEDGLTQRELSQRVGMMEPTTVTALNGMEKRGYVRRVRNTEDRRKVNVFLTRKGRSLRNKLLPYAIDVNRFATEGVSEGDLEILRATLRRMRDKLQAESA